MSTVDISTYLGITTPAVSYNLKITNVKIRDQYRNDLRESNIKEQIIDLYINNKSTREIGKLFNTSHSTIEKILKENNIPTRSRKESLSKYCRINKCVICGKEFKPRENYKDTKSLKRKTCSKGCLSILLSMQSSGSKSGNWKGGSSQSYYQKERNKLNIDWCEICGKKNVRLDTHHIDRDRTNNKRSNIMVLCVNCHAYLHYIEDDRGLRGWKGISKQSNL